MGSTYDSKCGQYFRTQNMIYFPLNLCKNSTRLPPSPQRCKVNPRADRGGLFLHRKYVVTRMCKKIHNVCPLNFGTNLKLRRFSKVSCKKGQIPAGPFQIRTSFRIWGQTKILPGLPASDSHRPARPRANASRNLPAYTKILSPGAGGHPRALVLCEKSTKSTKSLMARPQNDKETKTTIKKQQQHNNDKENYKNTLNNNNDKENNNNSNTQLCNT